MPGVRLSNASDGHRILRHELPGLGFPTHVTAVVSGRVKGEVLVGTGCGDAKRLENRWPSGVARHRKLEAVASARLGHQRLGNRPSIGRVQIDGTRSLAGLPDGARVVNRLPNGPAVHGCRASIQGHVTARAEAAFLETPVDHDRKAPGLVRLTILIQVEPLAALDLASGLLVLVGPHVHVQTDQAVELAAALVVPQRLAVGREGQGIVRGIDGRAARQ